jgi:hypothetical protein
MLESAALQLVTTTPDGTPTKIAFLNRRIAAM